MLVREIFGNSRDKVFSRCPNGFLASNLKVSNSISKKKEYK